MRNIECVFFRWGFNNKEILSLSSTVINSKGTLQAMKINYFSMKNQKDIGEKHIFSALIVTSPSYLKRTCCFLKDQEDGYQRNLPVGVEHLSVKGYGP